MRESVISLMPCAVVSLDRGGRITALNRAAEGLLGVKPEVALGKPYPAVFGPSLSDRVVKLFLLAMQQGESGELQSLRATLPSGETTSLRAGSGPVRDASGQIIGALFVAQREASSSEPLIGEKPRASEPREELLLAALQRYVGPHVAASLDEHPSFLQVGGVRQVVTALHADVRGYTTIAEALEPEVTAQLLTRYHTAAVDALLAHDGTFDHFIGDAVLAIWNAPNPQPDHSQRALGAAVAFQQAVHQVGSDLRYGLGLHTGDAIVGNLGSERYVNYTAIGDSINIAARLQAAAGPGEIVCSRATLDALDATPAVTPLGDLTVKGRAHTVEAYRVEWAR